MFSISRRRLFPLFPALAVPLRAATANDFSFALIGDRTGSAQAQIYSRVFREVILSDPAFAVSIGGSSSPPLPVSMVPVQPAANTVTRRTVRRLWFRMALSYSRSTRDERAIRTPDGVARLDAARRIFEEPARAQAQAGELARPWRALDHDARRNGSCELFGGSRAHG